MFTNRTAMSGRHFLQIPGPTNVPDLILRAINAPTIDHRGPEFAALTFDILDKLPRVFQTQGPVIIFPASGTGAWEAALVNCLSPADKILMCETGHFAKVWGRLANKIQLNAEIIPTDWRQGADPDAIKTRLEKDGDHLIKAVCVVHNETSTGVVSDIKAIRAAINQTNHPALLMVDTISSLASLDYRHDEWGVDVTVAGSQKGLMLPPGLSFNAISAKALQASKQSTLPNAYWGWDDILASNKEGQFPYTPSTNLLYGLKTALDMLLEEGLENVFSRHLRLAEATRCAVRAWGLEILCQNADRYSNSLTAVLVPDGHDADQLRKIILDNFNMSLGNGLGQLSGKVFRIGHLGDFNELSLIGTLGGVEIGLKLAQIPHKRGGAQAAIEFLAAS
ncbi:pyridoxal-phosphate-dependent aminotransferase family protein [Arenicellales bacterium nBUS_45]